MKSKRVGKFFTDFIIGFVVVKSLILFNAFIHWEDPPPHLDDVAISYRHLQDKVLTSNDSFRVSFFNLFLAYKSVTTTTLCNVYLKGIKRLKERKHHLGFIKILIK